MTAQWVEMDSKKDSFYFLDTNRITYTLYIYIVEINKLITIFEYN